MLTLFFGFDFNGHIGAPKLTELTTDAVLWSQRRGLFLIVQFQHLLRAKFNTYAASFTPIPVDMMLFEFWFGHL
jgi:hypothetical protein